MVRWIINLAPFGIMGLVFTNVSGNGLSIFTQYGSLLLLLVGTMLTMAFIINPIIIFIYLRCNPYPLVLRCLRESGLTAFFTRSSAANIPVNMALCEKLDLDKDIYSVSIPLGRYHQYGRRGHHHHHYDVDCGQHAGNAGLLACRHPAVHHVRAGRLRCIGVAYGSPAADPHGLLSVRYLQRRCHAGRRRGLHHRA